MGLRVWNNLSDKYNHDQLADNFAKIDFHDHSSGRGHQIPTEGIKNAAVTQAKLAPDVSALVPDNTITLAKMTDNSVGTLELINLNVTSGKIATDAVVTSKIQDLAVTQGKLAPNSVGSGQIIDGEVSVAELASNAVTLVKLAPSSVDNSKIVNNAGIELSKLEGTPADELGVNSGGVVRRGKAITTGEHTRNSGASGTDYGALSGTLGIDATDEVRQVSLASDGLLVIGFQGIWKESVAGAARAAIFIGSNQLKVALAGAAGAAPVTSGAQTDGVNVGVYRPLAGAAVGLVSATSHAAGYAADATTGQAIGLVGAAGFDAGGSFVATPANGVSGGFCAVFALAGTYDVSVRFKVLSGTVSAKGRKLLVEARGYGI